MEDKILTHILNRIRLASKEIIQREFPNEIDFFDAIWDIMEKHISVWEDISPNEWPFGDSKFKTMNDLKFKDRGKPPIMIAPIAIAVISAVLMDMSKMKYALKEKEIGNIVEKYSDKFGAPERLKYLLKKYVLPSILISFPTKEKKEFFELRGGVEVVKEKTFARMWTLRTDNPENGKIISKEKYEKILRRNRKGSIPLLIIKSNRIKTIFIKRDTIDLSGFRYKILEYVMKNQGKGGDLLNLLANVWNERYRAENLRRELEEAEKNRQKKPEAYYLAVNKVMKTISKLNGFLRTNLNVELKSFKTGEFKFTRILEYYLIEKL